MSSIRLLIVDDEPGQRDLLSGFLSKKGYETHVAGDGEQALELYHKVFAPVAVVDMKMPGMDGLQLLEKLREINPFIQVIVLTAFGSVETAVAAMKASIPASDHAPASNCNSNRVTSPATTSASLKPQATLWPFIARGG